MSVETVVLPTLAVVLAWACVAVVITGFGTAVRRLLAGRSTTSALSARRPVTSDIWVGFAALIAYLLVWNLVLPIAWYAWALPAVVGVPVAVAGVLPIRDVPWRRLSPPLVVTIGACVLWLANASLRPAQDYDFGLYHLNLIEYAKRYATIPGLANLQPRLDAADGHLLFAALLDHGPLAGAGPHLTNGLLAAMLIFDVGSRFAIRPLAPRPWSFARNVALLLLPATVIAAGVQITHRISSPNLDFSTFVLVVVGMLYLAEYTETRAPIAALTATAALAAVSTTRPLYWASTAFALVTVAFTSGRSSLRVGFVAARGVLRVCALPATLFLAWAARQAVVSGYPFIPLTFAALPVGWRVPVSVIRAENRVDDAWARLADIPPSVVFASWHWLHWWWPELERNADVIVPASLLACALLAVARGGRRGGRAALPALAILVPSLVSLVVWFFVAPDPRFVWAPFWLVPISVCAWVMPSLGRRPPLIALIAAAGIGVGLAILELDDPVSLVPVALAAALLAAVAVRARLFRGGAAWVTHAAVVSVMVAGIGIAANDGAFHVEVANAGGALGVPPNPVPRLVAVPSRSGFRVWEPVRSNQCWAALLCTPALVVPDLRLRGSALADGFTAAPRRARTFTLSPTRACLARGGARTLDTVGFIASTATGGAFVAELGDNSATISFGADRSDAAAIVQGYERVAFANVRSGLAGVLHRYGNAVTLWHRRPSASDLSTVLTCLS